MYRTHVLVWVSHKFIRVNQINYSFFLIITDPNPNPGNNWPLHRASSTILARFSRVSRVSRGSRNPLHAGRERSASIKNAKKYKFVNIKNIKIYKLK